MGKLNGGTVVPTYEFYFCSVQSEEWKLIRFKITLQGFD